MSSTRKLLVDTLQRCGYITSEFLLTPLQFGIPNSRLRYYLLAKSQSMTFARQASSASAKTVLRYIPGSGELWADDGENDSVAALSEYLDTGFELDALTIPDRVLEKWGRLFDIVKPSSRRTCCFTRGESIIGTAFVVFSYSIQLH